MHYRLRSLLVLTVVTLATSVRPSYADEPDKLVEEFIAKVQAEKVPEGFDALYGSNPWMKKSTDAITNLRNQLASLPSLVGKLRNVEKLQDITVGTRFRYISYLAAYDRQPIRFVFEFYKPESTWFLFSFSYDDKLDDEVEKTAADTLGRQ